MVHALAVGSGKIKRSPSPYPPACLSRRPLGLGAVIPPEYGRASRAMKQRDESARRGAHISTASVHVRPSTPPPEVRSHPVPLIEFVNLKFASRARYSAGYDYVIYICHSHRYSAAIDTTIYVAACVAGLLRIVHHIRHLSRFFVRRTDVNDDT